MTDRFHENVPQADVKPPSDRSTGLVFAAVALIVAIMWRHSPAVLWIALAVAVILAAVAWLRPHLLHGPAMAWFRLGMLLHKIVNPVVMLLMFAIAIVPTGFIMRFWYDPLNFKKTSHQGSYWRERSEEELKASSMRNQF